MNGKIKIEWNSKGFEEIVCSSGSGDLCRSHALRIQDAANAELTSDHTQGFMARGKIVYAYGAKRWMWFIHTTDAATMHAEALSQILSKAVK